jgi:NitT/TauT family transport system substrate-binding protein
MPSLILAAVALLAFSGVAARAARPDSEPYTVRVTTLPNLSHAPLFIAQEEGYFEEQGVDVEFVTFRRTATALPSLVRGDLDVFMSMIKPAYLSAMLRIGNVKLVAIRGALAPEGCVGYAVMARKDLVENGALEGPGSLRNLRLGADRESATFYLMDTLLRSGGLTLDDVESVQLPYTLKVEAFRRDLVDVTNASEPWLTRVLEAGDAVVWIPSRDILPGFQFGFTMFGPTLLEQNREAGRRFMTAYLRGVRQYNDSGKTARNVEIVAKHLRVEADLLEKACWSYHQGDGRLDFEAFRHYQAWAVGQGFIDRPLSESEMWDSSFTDHANRVLEGAP